MLAPGEYLIKQPEASPASSTATQIVERTVELPRPTAPITEPAKAERESFLLILLRALGAVHT
jgi:hypothetical protein